MKPNCKKAFWDGWLPRCVVCFLLLALAGAATASEEQRWLETAKHQSEPVVIDCPFTLAERPEPSRFVLQIIENTLHSWEEHDFGSTMMCIVLMRPTEGLLSQHEALDLLNRSTRWIEQEPDLMALQKSLSGGRAMPVMRPDHPALRGTPPVLSSRNERIPESSDLESIHSEVSVSVSVSASDLPEEGDEQHDFLQPNHLEPLKNLEAMQPMGGVIGNDDRQRVEITRQRPFSGIGFLGWQYPNDAYD